MISGREIEIMESLRAGGALKNGELPRAVWEAF